MAFSNKELRVGDLLETEIGEVYLYLGYFEGRPYSYYSVPDYGHMYIFCDNMHCLRYGLGYDKSVSEAVEALEQTGTIFPAHVSAAIAQRNWCRLRDMIDGNGRYTKSYIKFKRLVGHVDIPGKEKTLKFVYNCRRLGDKKPRGFKG